MSRVIREYGLEEETRAIREKVSAIVQELMKGSGNLSRAAPALGILPKTLRTKIRDMALLKS